MGKITSGTSVDGISYGIPATGYGFLSTVMEDGVYIYSNVTPAMSIVFGISWYAYSMKMVIHGNCNSDYLAVMVAYNGVGDPNYEKKITEIFTLMNYSIK